MVTNTQTPTDPGAQAIFDSEIAQKREPAVPKNAVDALAERDRQHAPVDRAKRALGLPK